MAAHGGRYTPPWYRKDKWELPVNPLQFSFAVYVDTNDQGYKQRTITWMIAGKYPKARIVEQWYERKMYLNQEEVIL